MRPLSCPLGTLPPWMGKGIVIIPHKRQMVISFPCPFMGKGCPKGGKGVAWFYFIHYPTSFLLVREMIISCGLSPLSISFSLPLERRSVSATCSSGTMNLRFTRMNLYGSSWRASSSSDILMGYEVLSSSFR